MEQSLIDLHTHSTESDGTFTPEELMQEAARVGLSAIALTDHDTTGGIAMARPVAKSLGIELIPGVELSTTYEGCEVHIVGLFIDENNEFLCQKLAEFRSCRDNRNEKMVENPILGNAEEGALFSLTEDGKIVVNNPHKADLGLAELNRSLSSI